MLELTKKHQLLLIAYDNPINGTLGTISMRSVLRTTNCDTLKCRKAPHLWAGFAIFKNTSKVRKFVNRWLSYCENYDLITGKNLYPDLKPHVENLGHQHDETLLGITNFQEDVGQYILPISEWGKYAMNIRRKRDRLQTRPSLLPRQLRNERRIRISRHIYRHPIMIRLRNFLFKN